MKKIIFLLALLVLLLLGCEKASATREDSSSCAAKKRVVHDLVGFGWTPDSVDVYFMLSDANTWKTHEVVYLSVENLLSSFAHGHFKVKDLDRVVEVEDLGPWSIHDPNHNPDAWPWIHIEARWIDGTCRQTATIHNWHDLRE